MTRHSSPDLFSQLMRDPQFAASYRELTWQDNRAWLVMLLTLRIGILKYLRFRFVRRNTRNTAKMLRMPHGVYRFLEDWVL